MTEVKVPRLKVRQLGIALQACIGIEVPAKFRYAIKRNLDSLKSDTDATAEAFKEPKKEDEEAHKKWEAEWKKHMDEEVTVQLYMTKLPEINDTRVADPVARAMQNQGIVEWLMPIIEE